MYKTYPNRKQVVLQYLGLVILKDTLEGNGMEAILSKLFLSVSEKGLL